MLTLREATAYELPFLREMLYEAIFWDPVGERPAPVQVWARPELSMLLDDWGRVGDVAVVAEQPAGAAVGAAWFRLWSAETHSYGFVDERTPELGLAVRAGCRGRGVGRFLLRGLIDAARRQGYPALSLSVARENRARRLYESEGFRIVGEVGTSWTLLLEL